MLPPPRPAGVPLHARLLRVFFYDPDAIKLELVHRPNDGDLATEVRRFSARLERFEQEHG